jgi:hypothetical protein
MRRPTCSLAAAPARSWAASQGRRPAHAHRTVGQRCQAAALEFNLGLLLQEEAAQNAHGARWRALADLLPNISAGFSASSQIINLEAYGFQADPSIIGPFSVYDARVRFAAPSRSPRRERSPRGVGQRARAGARRRTARDL